MENLIWQLPKTKADNPYKEFWLAMIRKLRTSYQSNETTLKWVATLSFLWSTASLMVFSIMPAFLVEELKMGHSRIGIIEALAYSSSFASKFFSGFLSDVIQQRKSLIMLGTILSAATKPLFAICTGAGLMSLIRFMDRLSKGIRTAPTDALIADLSDRNLYASNFGLRQSVYTLGAVNGALIAMIIMVLSGNNYRLVFALSLVPALMAVLVLWVFVRPNPNTHPRAGSQFQFKKIGFLDFKKFNVSFWWLIVAFFFLMLARFSEAFLSLKAMNAGWSIAYLPALIIFYDLVHAGVAWPAGKYADLLSRKQMLVLGLLMMVLSQSVLSYVGTVPGVLFGVFLLGLHMGITQGLLKALIAESVPPELRGTAFAVFFMVSGCALFLSNTIAGNLSEQFGLYSSFLAGAFFTMCSALIIYFVFIKNPRKVSVF